MLKEKLNQKKILKKIVLFVVFKLVIVFPSFSQTDNEKMIELFFKELDIREKLSLQKVDSIFIQINDEIKFNYLLSGKKIFKSNELDVNDKRVHVIIYKKKDFKYSFVFQYVKKYQGTFKFYEEKLDDFYYISSSH